MIVTTSSKTTDELNQTAKSIANTFGCNYIPRRKESVQSIMERTAEEVLVVSKSKIECYQNSGEESFFFHPNSAMFRLKRVARGESDPFLDATGLDKGMSFLDCTIGLASDSILASYKIGIDGKVIGTEENNIVAFIVKQGLQTWQTGNEHFDNALRGIQVENMNHLQYLQTCLDNQFDVIYFDPMFEEDVNKSDGIQELKKLACYSDITEEIINEAKRVARCRVVLKDHFRSKRFEAFGFEVIKRKSATFHFGVIEISRT